MLNLKKTEDLDAFLNKLEVDEKNLKNYREEFENNIHNEIN